MERKNIAIIGAGFGGLRTALLIGKKLKKLKLEARYRILLIDRNEYHTYTPTLYEVATNDPEFTSYTELREIVTFNLDSLIANLPIEIITAVATEVNPQKSIITFAERDPLTYDYLVLAPGSEANYFNIPGLKEHATPLKTFRDSIEIREYILNAMHHTPRPIQVVVGGGGSAGVELAGEIRCWLNKIHSQSRGGSRSRVSIIESATTVLSQFPRKIGTLAMQRLNAIGVRTITNTRITLVKDNLIFQENGKTTPFDVLIWTGGIKPNNLLQALSLVKDTRGYLLTDKTMRCSFDKNSAPDMNKNIFALGDSVSFIDEKTGNPVPQTAHVALEQGAIAASAVVREIQMKEGVDSLEKIHTFIPKKYPYIIPIGGKYAIASIGGYTISGFFGWILKGVVEFIYLTSLMPLRRALRVCLKGFRIIIKNDKL